MPRSSVVVIRAASTGRILLLRRGRGAPWCPSCWALPGGEPLFFESPVACAQRELREETGLSVGRKALRFLGTPGGRTGRDKHPRSPDLYAWYFLLEVPHEVAPTLDREHTDWRWASIGQWPRPAVHGLQAATRQLLRVK